MRRRLIPLIVAVMFIVSAPAILTPEHSSSPFVAQAGHTIANGWCECGCSACICDPGEHPQICSNSVAAIPDSERKHKTPVGSPELFGLVGMLIVGLRLWLLSR